MRTLNSYLLMISILICFNSCSKVEQSIPLPLIAQHDCIDLNKIDKLKVHWIKDDSSSQLNIALTYLQNEQFNLPQTIEVYTPIDGTIESIKPIDESKPLENVKLTVASIDDPTINVELFGIDLLSDEWGAGKVVKAGMHIGYAHVSDASKNASVCVIQQAGEKKPSHSFLDITVDYVFEHYQRRNINQRDSINPFILNPNLKPTAEISFQYELNDNHINK